jgi:hypothetical protein
LYGQRWALEVTLHEVREHVGVETQSHWSELASLQTTPALLGLSSLVALLAHQHTRLKQLPTGSGQPVWYHKTQPTFGDALALVRGQLWQQE